MQGVVKANGYNPEQRSGAEVTSLAAWIDHVLRISGGVAESVAPAPRADRIAAQVPRERRIVIAHVVVEVVRGGVGPLAGEAQRVLDGAGDGVGAAVGRELAVPHDGLARVGDLLDGKSGSELYFAQRRARS